MTGGLQRQNTGAGGPHQTSTGRSNRQTVESPREVGTEQGSRHSQEEQGRDGSETPELGQVENGSNEKRAVEHRKGGGSGTGSGPSGMDTEMGNSSGQQGCAGSSGDGEGTQEPVMQERVVDEVARTVANTGLEDGKARLDVGRNVGEMQVRGGETEQEPERGGRDRRVPAKVYMLESSDEDEADVDDEEGEGLDEVDDLDGSWQATLPSKHLRVLLVEDDDCTRHVVAALLRNCGYEVTPAADGFQALKLLSDKMKQFDLVLTEVVMPGLSGIQLLSRIQQRDQHKRMPVIMMSSKDATDVVFKCFQRGAADFLVKPVRKNELKNLWQHVWRRCKSSSGSGSGGSGTNAATKVPRKERGRVRDGSGDRSGSGSDSAGGQVNVGGNGSDNGSGTRNESSPVPDEKVFANGDGGETSPPLEEKALEVQREETPERRVENLLQTVGGKDGSRREEVSRGQPMRERGGDAGVGSTRRPEEEEGSPSRSSEKAADLIGNFVEEKAVEITSPRGGEGCQPAGAERGGVFSEDGEGRGPMPGLELSLKRGRPAGDSSEEAQPPSKQQMRTLRQSGGSAFSRYSMGGAMTNSSRQSQNQPPQSQHVGGYSSGPIGPPHNGGSAMGSFMPPEFQMPSAFQMPTHLLPPDFSNPRTVEAGPEMQGPSRLGSGEVSSAAKRQTGGWGAEPAGPAPPQMKEEYSAGPLGPSSMTIPPQGFMPPGFPEPGFGPFPPHFGYYFQPQNTGTAPTWNSAPPRKDPPNPPLPPAKPQNPKDVSIHHHHHHHHHTHHHDANQRHHDASPRHHDGPPERHPKHNHHKVSHPQATRAADAPGGESGLAGSSRQEIAQSRAEQAGKVAAHLDRAEHMEKRESHRMDGLDTSGGSDNPNSSGGQSNANNTSGGGSNFGSNGRSSATPGSGATTETGTGTGASGTGAEANQQTPAHAPQAGASDMALDGMEEVDRSARREAALNKFRQKRKERNFEKKVRYQSRKRLAEQRPRIRGQFVRQATFPNAVQQFVRPGSQGESL